MSKQKYDIECKNWDSFNPQPLTDRVTGKAIGKLMPRATQAQLGFGIQGWSRPKTETRSRLDP